jgi:hypothetical protein
VPQHLPLRQLCCTAAEIKNKTAYIDSHDDVKASIL